MADGRGVQVLRVELPTGEVVGRHFWGTGPKDRRRAAEAWAEGVGATLVEPVPKKKGRLGASWEEEEELA